MSDTGIDASQFGDYDPLDAVTAEMPVGISSAIWLDGMGDFFRGLGLIVIEHDGWERRGRSGDSPYSVTPTHIMWHHTASNTSPQNDVDFMMWNADVAPLANIMIDRGGVLHLMAAGPTNTNGSGDDTWGGGVPSDSMNSYAIGIEIANDGVGENYPAPQLDTLLLATSEALKAMGRTSFYCRSHFEWAPDRKIDVAGNSPYAVGAAQWNMEQARADLTRLMNEEQGASVVAEVIEVLTPATRIIDSRWFGEEDGRVGDDRDGDSGRRAVTVPDPGGAVAIEATITVVGATGPGFVTVWRGGGDVPEVSALNFVANDAISNTTTIPINSDGRFEFYLRGDAHIIIDLVARLKP